MTPEQILAIAASQWTEIPTPAQIIKALEAGRFKIVSADADPAVANGSVSTIYEVADPSMIKEARIKLGLTQTELAAMAGTTQQTLERLENGDVKSSRYIPGVLKALASSAPIVEDPLEYVRSVLAKYNLSPSRLARMSGINPSTLNRQLHDPDFKCVLSTRTLNKIRAFDRANQGASNGA